MFVEYRPVPFHYFTLFVVHFLSTENSPNAGRKCSACVGGTGREKREDNKHKNLKNGLRPG